MRSRVRPYATEAFLLLLAVAQQAELWLARRPAAGTALAVLIAMTTLPLLARRRAPLLSILTCFAAQAAVIELLPRGLQSTFFAALAAAAIAGALPGAASVVGGLAAIAVLADNAWLDPLGGGFGDFALSVAVFGAFWAGGHVLARRSRAARQLAERLAVGERTAVAAERARITRELHDVVAHGLTVVVVQAAAAQHAVGQGAAAAEVLPRLAAVEDSARQALADLRRMLGMLRAEASEEMTVPAAGRAGIDELVERVNATGTPVSLTVTGDPCGTSPGQDLVVYRIVQEALTNAVKHAPGAEVRIDLGYTRGEVRVRVANGATSTTTAGPVGGMGHGLIGMRERVALYGGHLRAGPQPDGGYAVAASVPTGEVGG